MDSNQRRSRRLRRSAPRRSFKPEVEVLEKRALLSGGLAVSAVAAGGTVSSGRATSGPAADQSGAAVVFSKEQLQVTPGGPGDSYTIVLATQPTADVTITINQAVVDPPLPPGPVPVVSPDGGPLQVTPSMLTFTPDDWSTPQPVQVTEPAVPQPGGATGWVGPQIALLHDVTSDDPNYNGLSVPPVLVREVNPNQGAVLLSKNSLQVTGGGAGDSYTVALASQPTANVTVTIAQLSPEVYLAAAAAVSAPAGSTVAYPVPICWGPLLNVSPGTLTFTPEDWSTSQTVTVTAPAFPPVPVPYAGDGVVTVSLFSTVTSTDPNYNDLCVPPVTVTVHEATPANGAAVIVSTDHLNVTPGATGATYTVVLASKPTDTVTVTIAAVTGPTPLAGAGPNIPIPLGSVPLQITPATLTFTPDNWDTPQTVTVSAPASGPEFGFDWLASTVTSNDADYNGIYVPPVFVAVVAPTVPPPVGPPVAIGSGGSSDPSQAAGPTRHGAHPHRPKAHAVKKVRHAGARVGLESRL